jgi:hypothetical protein
MITDTTLSNIGTIIRDYHQRGYPMVFVPEHWPQLVAEIKRLQEFEKNELVARVQRAEQLDEILTTLRRIEAAFDRRIRPE